MHDGARTCDELVFTDGQVAEQLCELPVQQFVDRVHRRFRMVDGDEHDVSVAFER